VPRTELVGLLRRQHERLADQAVAHGCPRGLELGVVAVGEHRAELRPSRRVRRAQAREVLQARGHRLLDERVDAPLEALARHRRLEVEERRDHGEVGALAVEHGPPVVHEERARVLVGRPRGDAPEAPPVRPVAHPEGEVDVPARSDDDRLHGSAPVPL